MIDITNVYTSIVGLMKLSNRVPPDLLFTIKCKYIDKINHNSKSSSVFVNILATYFLFLLVKCHWFKTESCPYYDTKEAHL